MMEIIKDIPAEFYEPKFYNKLSFKVINCLNNSFSKSNELLEKEGYKKYENLTAIFFHHLTKLLTSYIFCKSEIILSKIKLHENFNSLVLSNTAKIIWPINYKNILNGDYKPIGHD